MARARNIKPAFFKNYELADAGPVAQILFAGLWCLADREGRLEDKPRLIKAELFPYYDCDVNGELTVLQRLGFVRRYVNAGVAVIEVLNFKKHQAPHNTEKASTLPAFDPEFCDPAPAQPAPPGGNGGLTVNSPLPNDGKTPDSLIPDSLSSDSLIPDPLTPSPAPGAVGEATPDLFARFWGLYPNKKGKTAAEKAWHKLKVTEALFTEIADGLGRYCVSREWTKDGGQYIPHPATWLNGKRWQDEVRPAGKAGNVHHLPNSNHTGFEDRNYFDGLTKREDGTYGLA